ncbi:MAG: CDP-alcohol phosphatidyltransferase family protein [Candidatus Coatesbacteria bacterium]|nr:CDP-alcohol phosphatidyltransferase family protein [Candidatus Coatesbacteria bacterium]
MVSQARFNTIPNYLSLFRIFLTAPILYFIIRSDETSRLIALIMIILAGITDGLDGFLARKLNQESNYGLILDPLADKILIIAIAITFIFYFGFPLWLALVILSRDLLIVAGNLHLMKKMKVKIPKQSNYLGKFTFNAFVVLMLSYYLDFSFGKHFNTVFTLLLILLSMISYSRLYMKIIKREEIPDQHHMKDWLYYMKYGLILAYYFLNFTVYLYCLQILKIY